MSAGTGAQTPSLPLPLSAAVHASQPPPQALSQQTPSAQNVEPHSLPPPHATPAAFFVTQAPAEHQCVEAHWASVVQVARQCPTAPSHA